MRVQPIRRHLTHFEHPGKSCHITWRLDRAQVLLNPTERTCVLEVIRRSHEFGARILATVVMDDHVHVLFDPGGKRTSAQFATAWKSTSAHLLTKQGARFAPIWQAEYYQRWLSSPHLIPICAQYIRDNPQRKWPGIGEYRWVMP